MDAQAASPVTVDINCAEPNRQEGEDDMSRMTVIEIIERALSDEAFRLLLLTSPDEALSGYDLTADEHQRLRGLTPESFDEFTGTLDDRGTKGWIPRT